MEVIGGRRVRAFEDASPYREDPEALRTLAARDGFLFFRALVPTERLAALRARVLDHAARVGWLACDAPREEARAAPGKRIGGYQDPDWVNLQVAVQTNPELWELGDCVAI
ncbi:MAG TPA: hypothetical protein VET85_09765, partial [Stellaceae bacterium]|nr:hypothetical protein [Stellaceae bacterium]